MALRSPEKFKSVSAFSPIVHPSSAPWGEKAFNGYLGNHRQDWLQYDATELVKSGKRYPGMIYIDQGSKDEFLATQLLTADFENACREANQSVKINYREGYDHSYYFISSFIADNISFHAESLRPKAFPPPSPRFTATPNCSSSKRSKETAAISPRCTSSSKKCARFPASSGASRSAKIRRSNRPR